MMTRKNILFIPDWVLSSMERRSVHLADVLDLAKMMASMAPMDMASIVALGNNSQHYLGVTNSDTDAVLQNWIGSESYAQVTALAELAAHDLPARLFDPDLKNNGDTAFKIIDIGASALAVVIYAGYFCGNTQKKSKDNLIRELIRLFYAYEGYDETARREIFVPYLASLISQ